MPRKTKSRALAAALLLLLPGSAAAGELEFTGSAGLEARGFFNTPQFAGQFSGLQPSLELRPELGYESDDRRHQFNLLGFGRLDGRDDERSHVDLREAYWRYIGDEWEALIGLNSVFWGVTESRHLVNIVNQIDQVEDIDREDFLGQPMITLASERDWGRVEALILPTFRERRFAGRDGRLRGGLTVDEDAAQYEADLGRENVDFALRYSGFLGDWDFGTHYFYGTSRDPRLTVNAAGTRLVPNYDLIHQAGLDLQYTQDAWLWKLEAIVREGQGETFGALVGGFEYTLFQVADSDADLGFLAEGLYDGRDENEAPATTADNDVFVGSRLALNDVQDTQALAGAVVDVKTQTTSFLIEAERRIGQSWKLELESRLFFNVDGSDPSKGIEDDDFALLRLTYFW